MNEVADIEDLVNMATVTSKKALHKFSLVKCKEQTMEFIKRFKLRGNTPTREISLIRAGGNLK